MRDRDDIVPAVEAAPVTSGLQLWWFGGPSYAIKSPRTLALVDPYRSDPRPDDPQGFVRVIPNYFSPRLVTRADLVLSTHDHADHCDPETLRPIYEQTAAVFAAAPSSAVLMRAWGFAPARVLELTPGVTTTVGDIAVTGYRANDWEDEGAATMVVSAGGASVFVGGDSLLFDDLERIERAQRIDLAVFTLGRNRRDLIDAQVYLTPEEVARGALALQARRVLPVHWDIWDAWVEDPYAVAPYLAGTPTELVVLEQGGTLTINGDS